MDRTDALLQMDVGGGITERAAKLVAVLHLAVDHKRAAEQGLRAGKLTGCQQCPHPAGRYAGAVELHRRHRAGDEARLSPHPLQQRDITAPFMTETEITTHPHFTRSQPIDQYASHKILSRHRGQGLVEAQQQGLFHASGSEAAQLFAHAG